MRNKDAPKSEIYTELIKFAEMKDETVPSLRYKILNVVHNAFRGSGISLDRLAIGHVVMFMYHQMQANGIRKAKPTEKYPITSQSRSPTDLSVLGVSVGSNP